jgi:hypothetical protein
MLGFSRILGGLVREQSRKLLKQPEPETKVSLTSLEPHTLW